MDKLDQHRYHTRCSCNLHKVAARVGYVQYIAPIQLCQGSCQVKALESIHLDASFYLSSSLSSCLMQNCGDCGGQISWDEDVCSAICTSCGTLQDPTQSVLVAHLDETLNNNSSRESNNPLWQASTTLKSTRRNGWNLSGQGKEVRDSKNTVRKLAHTRPPS